jgi:hypothetical protein
MGKTVHKFIDKKNAATYQLMSRPSETGGIEAYEPSGDEPRMFVRTDNVSEARFPEILCALFCAAYCQNEFALEESHLSIFCVRREPPEGNGCTPRTVYIDRVLSRAKKQGLGNTV